MILDLFNWLHKGGQLITWIITITSIALWWFLLWLIRRFLINKKIRPIRVIALAYRAFMLIVAIFIFNVAIVPVVLVSFHGMALITLVICGVTSFVYLIRVKDEEQDDAITFTHNKSSFLD